jgi:hypothetical protein
MKPLAPPLVALLIFAPSAFAKLEIASLQSSQGPYGPSRESFDVYPFDELFLRFRVAGAKPAEGKVKGDVTIRITSAGGQVVYNKTNRITKELSLGGDTFFLQGGIPIPGEFKPGAYSLQVSYRDDGTGETASSEQKFNCLPISFQIITPRFFRDPDFRVPTAVGGMTGENLHIRLGAIGFDKSQKKVQTRMTCSVIDSGGNVVSTPIVTRADLANPDEVSKAHQVVFNGAMTLNRAGEFTLRIVVEDVAGKQKATFETPLKVTNP